MKPTKNGKINITKVNFVCQKFANLFCLNIDLGEKGFKAFSFLKLFFIIFVSDNVNI